MPLSTYSTGLIDEALALTYAHWMGQHDKVSLLVDNHLNQKTFFDVAFEQDVALLPASMSSFGEFGFLHTSEAEEQEEDKILIHA